MRIFPIIPLWIMIILTIVFLGFILKESKHKFIDILIVILLFIINLRIMFPNSNSLVKASNLDVLFVIDNTISMNALDYNDNTRLSGVKRDCNYIIDQLSGSRFSIITFNNSSKIVIPFTTDINLTSEAIDIIKPIDELYAKGSSLNTPIDEVIKSLKVASKKKDRKRIIFFISDGEITNDEKLKSFKGIRKYVSNGAILGYGTDKGGYMMNDSEYAYDKYIMDTSDYNYGKAVSKIDEENLKKIANDIGIEYINMNSNNIKSKIREIKRLASSNTQSSDKKSYNDIYFIFVIPLFVLLIIKFKYIQGELL